MSPVPMLSDQMSWSSTIGNFILGQIKLRFKKILSMKFTRFAIFLMALEIKAVMAQPGSQRQKRFHMPSSAVAFRNPIHNGIEPQRPATVLGCEERATLGKYAVKIVNPNGQRGCGTSRKTLSF